MENWHHIHVMKCLTGSGYSAVEFSKKTKKKKKTKRKRYTTALKFLSAISLCKLTYLNLYSLALITLTSLFTERNNAECFLSLRCLSNTMLDRLQIKDQRDWFHYQAISISLLYHTNNLLKLSAIIFSPFRCRHNVMASTITAISGCVCVEIMDRSSLQDSAKNLIHRLPGDAHPTLAHTLTHLQEDMCTEKKAHTHTGSTHEWWWLGGNLWPVRSLTAWFSETSASKKNQYRLSGSSSKSIWLSAAPDVSTAPLITLQHYW